LNLNNSLYSEKERVWFSIENYENID
jgi:hypothetical protein